MAFIACIFLLCQPTRGEAPGGPWEQYKIQLTPQEIAWVRAHPSVRLGFDPAWPPFSFHGANGTWQGIDLELLARLSERLGIRFVAVETKSWQETDQKLHAGDVDVVSGISRTTEREKYLLFTSSYITCPVAVITRDDAPFLTSLHDLKNVTLAGPRNYVTTEQLIRDYPGMPLIQTDNVRDALTLVSQHKADVAIDNLPSASVTITAAGLRNLKIAGITDYRFGVCLAVRKDLPELQSILEKGLESMDEAERRAIMDHWTAVEYFPRTAWSRVWKIAGAVLLFAAVALAIIIKWNRHLARELDERKKAGVAIKAAHDQLHALNMEKDRFMSMAAHDLNNPLTTILMKCTLFEMDGNFNPDQVHDLLATVRSSTQRMSHLVSNLLNADKIEHGRMQLRKETLDLGQLVNETLDSLQPCAECKNIRMEFTGLPAPLRIKADRDAVLQVFENIISNAIKYTPPGRGVFVRLLPREGFGCVEVRDQGPGISAEDQPKLFGKYVTLSARPTGNEDSHGLGLSIAKSLVESMQGRISCESRAGEGAVFLVEFPAELELASATK